MIEAPTIVVYGCIQGEAPRAHDFIAYFVQGGKPLPMRFAGRTIDAARQAAIDWWAERQAIEVGKVERVEKMREARKAKAA